VARSLFTGAPKARGAATTASTSTVPAKFRVFLPMVHSSREEPVPNSSRARPSTKKIGPARVFRDGLRPAGDLRFPLSITAVLRPAAYQSGDLVPDAQASTPERRVGFSSCTPEGR